MYARGHVLVDVEATGVEFALALVQRIIGDELIPGRLQPGQIAREIGECGSRRYPLDGVGRDRTVIEEGGSIDVLVLQTRDEGMVLNLFIDTAFVGDEVARPVAVVTNRRRRFDLRVRRLVGIRLPTLRLLRRLVLLWWRSIHVY